MNARGAAAAIAALLIGSVQAGPCDTPAHREFDFWVGQWEVRTPDGKLAGTNRITREYGGCVLHERYDTGRGYAGESLNSFDAGRKVWHQTWVDNGGLLLLLEGGLRDGQMVLEGRTTDAQGKVQQHRITWSPQPGGRVRQHWQTRGGEGEWRTAFDGLYTPVAGGTK